MIWDYCCIGVETSLLNIEMKYTIPTCQLSVHKRVGKHEVLHTRNQSDDILIFYPVFFAHFKVL